LPRTSCRVVGGGKVLGRVMDESTGGPLRGAPNSAGPDWPDAGAGRFSGRGDGVGVRVPDGGPGRGAGGAEERAGAGMWSAVAELVPGAVTRLRLLSAVTGMVVGDAVQSYDQPMKSARAGAAVAASRKSASRSERRMGILSRKRPVTRRRAGYYGNR